MVEVGGVCEGGELCSRVCLPAEATFEHGVFVRSLAGDAGVVEETSFGFRVWRWIRHYTGCDVV